MFAFDENKKEKKKEKPKSLTELFIKIELDYLFAKIPRQQKSTKETMQLISKTIPIFHGITKPLH